MMNTRENRGTEVKGTERKEVIIMKNLFKTIKENIFEIIAYIIAAIFVIGLSTLAIIGTIEGREENIAKKIEKNQFEADCYSRYEEAMDYIYSDYSEYYYNALQHMAVEEFYENRAEMLEVERYDVLLSNRIRKMVERFERIYNFEHNIYPFYEEDASLGIYYNMPKEGKSLFDFSHKEEPKSLIAQMMDDLEEEFSKDHTIERDGNSMYIEPIEDVEKPVAEQKLELVSIEDVEK